jgi:tetratricopeptide (TPR) repeat protein
LRLLETTRAYVLTKLAESGESDVVGRRHAEFFRGLLESGNRDKIGAYGCLAENACELDNIRSALAWAFGASGDVEIGVALAAASAPLWLDRSLFTECAGWMRIALKSLEAPVQGSRKEMLLQAALGMSLMFTQGMSGEANAALTRGAELAGSVEDPEYQLQILHALWLHHIRLAEFPRALALARRSEAVAQRMTDPVAAATADRMLGISLHFLGDQANARAHLERALEGPSPGSRRTYIVRFGVDHRTFAPSILANVLWLQGLSDQALRAGETSIEEAQTLEHPVSLCTALKWGGGAISLWLGDLAAAERYTSVLIELAEKHALDGDCACGLGLQGRLSVKRGEVVTGARLLRSVLNRFHDAQHQVLCSEELT